MDEAERENQFLVAEYEQAWDHYRHIENSRAQYLGFFFTASVGSAALAAPVLSANAGRIDLQLISAIAFLAVFETFTFFVLVAVRRFGSVLNNYAAAMGELRARRVTILKIPEGALRYLEIERIGSVPPRLRWLSAQRSAVGILTGFLIAGVLLLVAAIVIGFEHQLTLISLVGSALAAGCTVYAILAVILWVSSRVKLPAATA